VSGSERVVGIDLGTTNTVVAVASDGSRVPRVLPIPQLVADGEIAAEALLPSVLFVPPPGEVPSDPWGDAPWIIGRYARARGARVPGRAVTSAKSWLCHAAVDRLAPILPWGTEDASLPRVSPVEASRRLLAHVRRAYDEAHPGEPLAEQRVVLTVPASFDEAARELTVRAAEEAGLRVRLLEEPLAAFYDYLARTGTAELAALLGESGAALVLVCDVGGGTTDLTLVRVSRAGGGPPKLDRVAVGRHLLLGGDNMDLTLAHALERDLIEPPERLEPALFAELVVACRAGKQRLLAESPPESVPVRVLSRGSSLVGRTLATELTRGRVLETVLDGFFPDAPRGAAPERPKSGLVAFGLPYERDPAITRHLGAFLERHAAAGPPLRAVLLNGGVFRSPVVRRRILDALGAWTSDAIVELSAPDPDLAVARGAVAFGLSLSGHGPRVGGGSARGYYVGLAARVDGRARAICVVPRATAEGERHVVAVPGLSLVVGQPVRFDLFASDTGRHAPGEVVTVDGSLDALPSMVANFETESQRAGSRVPVALEGELTAVGTLDVACVESPEGAAPGRAPARFRLAFDLRAAERASTRPPPSARPSDPKLEACRERIAAVFGRGRADADPRDARHLVRDLERILGERATWTTEVARAIFDAIAPEAKARRRSAEHERAFWMLAGYCLRPGYGHPLDPKRVSKLVPLFPELVVFADEARSWQQFFIAWRRVAGGLGEPMQEQIRDAVDPFLSTDEVKPKKRKGMRPQAPDEMLELASSLERLPPARRADLGRWILERTWTSRDPRLWTALGRVGARVPTYGSAHHVVPPSTVERWLDHLLREKWNEVASASRAATEMARVTGDRARDVSEGVRREIVKRLEAVSAPPEWVRSVLEPVPVRAADRAEFFGESLPAGLELWPPE
jgi:molecular chaperone DnaK (HSP70)